MSLSAGTRLGRYEIRSPLGSGGMGEVYVAKDTTLDRDVAIKILPESLADSADALKRFQREAKALAALSHPNIVSIFDVGEEQGIFFVVTELLKGNTLRYQIPVSGMQWQKALELAVAIGEGLVAAQSLRIIHRDLKPENIFVTKDGRIKILDFGLAHFIPAASSETDGSEVVTISRLTKSQVVLGTVPYMSPEQIRGAPIDERTDIFSFGCILYEMLTGQRLFQRESNADTAAAVLTQQPPPLSQSRKEIPQMVETILLHCLEKNRDQRFQTAKDLVFDLETASSVKLAVPRSPIAKSSYLVWLIPTLLVVLAVTGLLFMRQRDKKTINSLAILPFVNANANADVDFLSDGITERIIGSLSQLPQLRVMARSTVFSYKGKQIDPQNVGKSLRVGAVLTGSMIQRGDQLTLRAELVDTTDGSQIWGGEYNRPLGNLLQLEEEIASEISEKLQLKLTVEQKNQLTKPPTRNVEAYQSYLKGRYYWNKRTKDGFKKAKELFLQALDKDPNYALAYAGLADYYVQPGYNLLPEEEAYPKATAAAKKALELDPMLSEPYVVMAQLEFAHNKDPIAAERSFRKAIELDPNNASAYQRYSLILSKMGRNHEAITEMQKALELDPLSLAIQTSLGDVFRDARQYERATEQYKKAMEMDSTFAQVHLNLARLYEFRDMQDEALKEDLVGLGLSKHPELQEFQRIYKESGWRGFWQNELDFQLNKIKKNEDVDPWFLARIYIILGNNDKAIEWSEKYYAEDKNDITVRYDLQIDPMFDRLRSDPRFIDLMKRVNTAS